MKKIKYYPIVANIEEGIPTYWLVREVYYFGISWSYSLIGQDGKDSIPFQNTENMNYFLKQYTACFL